MKHHQSVVLSSPYTFAWLTLLLFCALGDTTHALSIVVAGGTGAVGKALLPRLSEHQVVVLGRNAFLAATPSRVSEQYGHLGQRFLAQNPHVRLRTYDAGDLLDIVGDDWLGWQDDCLKDADVVVHLTGGWTTQRIMACERLVRESYAVNKGQALHVTVNPTEEDLDLVAPLVARSIKVQRIAACEAMVQTNLPHHTCLRVEANRVDALCDSVLDAIASCGAAAKEPTKGSQKATEA